MTCRYSQVEWRDVIYNSVRNAPGGVVEAAKFLTARRGKTIHPEVLRSKLRGVDGESVSMEMAELLTEWLMDLNRPDARDWIHAFNTRFDMSAEELDSLADCGFKDQIVAIRDELLNLAVAGGLLTSTGMDAIEDKKITPSEAEAIEAQVHQEIRLLLRLARSARRAVAQDHA